MSLLGGVSEELLQKETDDENHASLEPQSSTSAPAASHRLPQGSNERALLELAPAFEKYSGDSACKSECLVQDVASNSVTKKPPDLMALSKKRVRLKLRADVRAARATRKKERARAKQRRGTGSDLEAFLARTQERVEARVIQAQLAEVAATQCPRRGSTVDIESFQDLTRERVDKQAALKSQKAAGESDGEGLAADQRVDEFRKKTRSRVVERMYSKLQQVRDGFVSLEELRQAKALIARRRIAVVGAGPVGLWVALLLELKYAGGPGHIRQLDAPEVVILEARPKESHCARADIRIALSSSTQTMMNQRTHAHLFASGMSVGDIESALLRRLEKVAPQQKIHFGRSVADPGSLANSEKFDCILWAGGRRSLDDGLRASLGCETRVGMSEGVLVFQVFELQGGGDIWQFAAVDFTGIARQATSVPTLRVMVRPGQAGISAGWLWIFGIPRDIDIGMASKDQTSRFQNMIDALHSLAGATSPMASRLRPAVEVLQQRVRPASCALRLVDAAFWSSDRVVCDLTSQSNSSLSCPLVLLGDAACGKPFYNGTTLNRHLWDAAALVDHVDWAHDGGALARTCFDAYERRYQDELFRIEEFGRRNLEPLPPRNVFAQSRRPRSAPRLAAFMPRLPAPVQKSLTPRTRPLPPLDTIDSITFSMP
mmetsp:Transcript_120519/g.191040  ORF Transcript_120519/g.191040 Transcript_120519/m.191040 type:complete len:659 (-) Transcript_120519:93-2069(-)